MRTKTAWLCVVAGVCAFGLGAGPAAAQQSQQRTREVRDFEVVSVDGNKVVVKGREGAKEYTVPEDFRFTVDGRSVSVHELKPGMKGTATITTTTTVKPVYVTEVRQGEVVRVAGSSIIVRGPDGFKMFSEGDVEKRGVKIYKDGRPVQFSDLRAGDRLTATIVTEGTPQVLTDREVKATLSAAAETPVAAPEPSTAAPSTPEASPATPGASPATPEASTPATTPTPTTGTLEQPATEVAETTSPMRLVLILGVILLAAILIWRWMRRSGATR